MSSRKWWQKLTLKHRLEVGLGVATGIYASALAFADLFGIVDGLQNQIAASTLLLVGLLSLFVVIERHDTLSELIETHRLLNERLNEDIERVHARLGGVHDELDRVHSSTHHVNAFFGAAASNDDRFSQLRLIYAARELAQLGNDTTLNLGKEYIFSAWLDCLNLASTFQAFNYVKPEEVWRSGWFESISHSAQLSRIVQGAKIQRIFVVDTLTERSMLQPLMAKQKSAGIDVSWVLTEDALALPHMREYLSEMRTRDLIAINDELVFKVFLDENRSMKSCSVSKDVAAVRRVKQIIGLVEPITRSTDDHG